jgi:protein transport protein SEC20
MAPIPSRLPEETLSLISAAERRYKHIAEVEIPELRKCIGPLSVQQALAEDVRESTITLTQQIEVCLPNMPAHHALVSIRYS